MPTMKAMVYGDNGKISLQTKPKPEIREPTDAVVKVRYTTICGSDTHILKGDVPSCTPGRTLGHEGVGTIDSIGDSVRAFKAGDPVLISCITSCATCKYCRRGMPSHCEVGGWNLGNTIDGTQAEFVRIPCADSSLFRVPAGVDEKALVMLSDIVPTGHEVGVLAGKIQPGMTVAIVGAGPVGLAALITAQLYSPSLIIVIDQDASRLEMAKKLGAHHTINNGKDDAAATVKSLTDSVNCDTVIETVGVPATFELCQELVAVGGHIANVGVHGKPPRIHLEKLWDKNITMSTGLVDTVSTPMLLRMLAAGTLHVDSLISHHFSLDEGEKAYATFSAAADNKALKMLISTA